MKTTRLRALRARWLTLLCVSVATLGSGCGARSSLDFLVTDQPSAGGTGGGAQAASAAGTTATAGSASAIGSCESITVSIDDLRPTVTLLVDQSGSMRFPYPDDDSVDTRWSLVGNALFDPTSGVVKTFELSVRFGIAFFTSDNGFSGGACPILSEVAAATQNYAALRALYDSLEPDDDTPTGAAIEAIYTKLDVASTARGPQSIILVTDGDPDTCEVPDPQEGQGDAVAAAQKAHAAGIGMYVVGISNDIDGQNLQELANAGAGRPIDAIWGVDPNAARPFQASDNVAGLTAQLGDILGRIPFCEVVLQRDVAVAEASIGQVVLDGNPLNYGDVDGYVLKDPRHLEIVGKACDAIKSGGKQLSVRISCAGS